MKGVHNNEDKDILEMNFPNTPHTDTILAALKFGTTDNNNSLL